MCASMWGLLCVACLLVSPLLAQSELQCAADIVSRNGSVVMFGSLSDGAGPVDASFDPGAIGGWNALANGFVDAVQSQDLPYDILIPVINSTFIVSQSAAFDPLSFLQNFAAWWAGILVVTLLGIFFGILFCIVGACFWCCRCCGNCGGSKTQETRSNNDCLTFTFAGILFLCTLVLLAGAILAFFSNEQTFRSVSNFQTTLGSIIQDTSNYINDTTQEVNELICQFSSNDGTLGAVIEEIDGISESLSSTINSISANLSVLINQLNSTAIGDVSRLLDDVTTEVAAITSTTTMLDSSLGTVVTNLDSASTSCTANGLGTMCDPISDARDAAQTARLAIPALPDLNAQLADVANAISGLGGNIMDGQNALDMVLGPQVTQLLNDSLSQVTPLLTQANNTFVGLSTTLSNIVDPLITTNFDAGDCPPIEEAFNGVTLPSFDLAGIFSGASTTGSPPTAAPNGPPLSLGYINACVIDAAFSFLEMFDVYRYAVGIVICCLALVTIVLMWVGLILGLVGFRRNLYPYDRSSVSHCGGICLLISVGFTFLFGFLLLLISAIFFFLGSNSLQLCQSLQGPDYSLFANTIDNPAIKGALIPDPAFSAAIPSISGVLRDCEENNTALFEAIGGNELLNTFAPDIWNGSIENTISSMFNLDELRATVDAAIAQAASGLAIDSSTITGPIQDALNQIPNDTLSINISSVSADLESAIAGADINTSITNLQTASSNLRAALQEDIADDLDATIIILQDIRDNQVPLLMQQLAQLQTTLDSLSVAAEVLRQNITGTANDLGNRIAMLSGPFLDNFINESVQGSIDTSFNLLFQYIGHLDEQLVGSVGGCQPLYGVYTQLHNTVCRNFLEGLNGFWWGLGFCSLLFIPVIIFAVLTSSFFLKKKAIDGDYGAYEGDYPMKGY